MTVFILVRSGGEYSDAYHINESVFVDKDEAEAQIEAQVKFIDICWGFEFVYEPCPDVAFRSLPAGTPNRKSLERQEANKILQEYSIQKEAQFKLEYNAYLDLLSLSPEVKEKALQWRHASCVSKPDNNWEIEEVEIPENSRLYRLLNQ